MSTFQPKDHLETQIRRGHKILVNDLKAIAEENQTACPGGVARTAVSVVAECAALNGFIANFLTTGKADRLPSEERQAFLATFDTADKAVTFLDEQTEKLLTAVAALDEANLGEEVAEPFGRPMTRFAIAELPAIHMIYHDGQLNYIQCLHGDSEIHWG